MTQVPHITIEQAKAIYGNSNALDAWKNTTNRLIDAYNEKQSQEQYITAEEARKLGAGNFEVLCTDGVWRVGKQYCPYRETWFGEAVKYRAIKQPEPVEPQFAGLKKVSTESLPPEFEKILHENLWELYESDKPADPHAELKAMYEQQVKDGTLKDFVWQVSDDDEQWHDVENNAPQFEPYANFHCVPKPTCQVRNEDTGELKTMTREAAKLLQAELGGTVEWFFPNGVDFGGFDVEFILGGIYSYKLHPLKQIEWTGSREDVIALLNELGFRC